MRQINEYTLLDEAVHPNTGEVYKVGENIFVKSGYKKKVIKINTMFSVADSQYIFISENIYKDEEYRRKHWASRPTGIFLNEAVGKASDKQIKQINDAKNLARQYV